MTLHNDYLVGIVMKQQQAELLDRSAEERLARELPGRSDHWWRRLVADVSARWRRPGAAGIRRAAEVRPIPMHSGTRP